MNFIKKLFGIKDKKSGNNSIEAHLVDKTEENNNVEYEENMPHVIVSHRNANKGKSHKELAALYFTLLDKIIEADKEKDINNLLMYCSLSLGLIESLIENTKQEYGSFREHVIPAIEKALIYFSVNGVIGQLRNIEDIVNYFEELENYKDKVQEAYLRKELASKIYKYISDNPNSLQVNLKKNIEFNDGRFIASTVHYMVNAEKLLKRKEGKKIILNINEKKRITIIKDSDWA